jgi:hypothetical protein
MDLSWLGQRIAQIKRENGVPEDSCCMVCLGCRKVVQFEGDAMFCDCHDERKGIDPNHPDVVPLEESDEYE